MNRKRYLKALRALQSLREESPARHVIASEGLLLVVFKGIDADTMVTLGDYLVQEIAGQLKEQADEAAADSKSEGSSTIH